ncbi:MAG: aldo/keto reductase [Methanobacterium sp.]
MLYRKLGSTEEEVSILGFGCMRFPEVKNNYGMIDEEKAAEMLYYAIDNGVNYLDTGYPYHNGTSETFLGNYLTEEYREKVHLATKIPSWNINTKEDLQYYLDKQLERLKTETIDFYLVHSLNKNYWPKLEKAGVLEFLDQLKEDGIIKHAGFSFHDDMEFFFDTVDIYNWDMCQIQYNFMDESYQAGREGLRYASSQGLGVIIMEPLRGGVLANYVPPDVQLVWDDAETKRSPAEWALKYIWDHEEVDIVLSGMSTLDQVRENIAYANEGYANSLTEDEKFLIKEAARAYRENKGVDCTSCGYCMPCPQGVNIPDCFMHYNYATMLNDPENAKMHYITLLREDEKASKCIECDDCKMACPQMIDIKEKLKDVVEEFER